MSVRFGLYTKYECTMADSVSRKGNASGWGGPIAGGVIYCVSGTLLTLGNKLAIQRFPQLCLLIIVQNVITTLLLIALTSCSTAFGGLPRVSKTLVCRWAPLSFLFVMMLSSSLMALKHISAVSLVVLRNLTTIVVAVGERMYLGTEFSRPTLATLCGMLFGAGIFGSADLAFNSTGYVWLLVNILASSIYQVYVKSLAKDDSISPLGMSFISNLLSLPVLLIGSFILGEIRDIDLLGTVVAQNAQTALIVLLSGLLGFALSTSAFLLNTLISATSIMVINNANKFAVILLSELFMERSLVPLSSTGAIIVLFCAYMYSNCSKMQKADPNTTSDTVFREQDLKRHMRRRDLLVYTTAGLSGALFLYALSARR